MTQGWQRISQSFTAHGKARLSVSDTTAHTHSTPFLFWSLDVHWAGYRRSYAAVRDYLVRNVKYPDRLKVVGKEDQGTTAHFELSVVGTGQVLHSKRHANQGKAESDDAKRQILDQVNELIEEMVEEEEEDGEEETEEIEA